MAKLTPSDAANNGFFGISVFISDDTAIVGDDHRHSADGSTRGAAYLFRRDHGGSNTWGEVALLTASDAADHDRFGNSVAIFAGTALIGAWRNDDAGSDSGAAYIYQRDFGGQDNWGELAKLTASDAAELDRFGWRVSISGDTAVVGARMGDGAVSDSGAVYVFQRNQGGPGNWGEVQKLTASDAATGALFGESVSIDNATVVVGAAADSDPIGFQIGAAYVFGGGPAIPTVSTWGLIVMTLLVLATGTLVLNRRRPRADVAGRTSL